MIKEYRKPQPLSLKLEYKFALIIFVLILVFHGTYFRNRPDTDAPTADWLVIARLASCTSGLIVGIFLLKKHSKFGTGAKLLLIYTSAAGISSVSSPYVFSVLGYFMLLAGASVLMIGMVYSVGSNLKIELIEKVWLITMSFLVLKDTITSLTSPQVASTAGVARLAMGVTHANEISMLAAIIFWMSFLPRIRKTIWIYRAFLIFVLVRAVSRVSIAAFLAGGIFYLAFKKQNSISQLLSYICVVNVLICFIVLNSSFGQDWPNNIVNYIKRGQEKSDIYSFTGRTDIWQLVFKKAIQSPILGYGFGVSRLTMGSAGYFRGFQPKHSHNGLLEVFLSMGLLGLIPFLLIWLYSVKWILQFSTYRKIYPRYFCVHAICINMMFLISSIFEAGIAGRLNPFQLLFFLYFLALDKKKDTNIPLNKDFSKKGLLNKQVLG